MTLLRHVLALPALLAALFLAGCASPAPTSPFQGAAVRSATVSALAPEQASMIRGGLGTGFGETRDSRIGETGFVRAGERPAATDRLHYNDLAGAQEWMAAAGAKVRPGSAWKPVPGGLVSWGVRSGGSRVYEVNGERMVAGKEKARYELVVRSQTARRLEIVLSVDGLDVMDGHSASFRKRGYVLDGHGVLRVDGFRTSEETVAAFRFSSVSGSYAARKYGETRNVGVIGLAVFEEQGHTPGRWAEPPPGSPELARRRQANPFPDR